MMAASNAVGANPVAAHACAASRRSRSGKGLTGAPSWSSHVRLYRYGYQCQPRQTDRTPRGLPSGMRGAQPRRRGRPGAAVVEERGLLAGVEPAGHVHGAGHDLDRWARTAAGGAIDVEGQALLVGGEGIGTDPGVRATHARHATDGRSPPPA